jgi:voltage-gated potassium channel
MFDRNPMIRRLFACCAVISAVLLIGTFGYVWIEHWSLGESFFMSVITLSTVGYGETRDLTPVGRLFTSGLIFLSIVGLSCWTASLTSLFVEGDLSGAFRRKKSRKMAAKFTKHTIVCGSGVMAQAVVERLVSKKISVVVVDDDAANLAMMRQRYPGVPIIESSAVDEMALFDANVLNASNVVAALSSDFDNMLIAMTCQDLGTDIKVVARSNDMRIGRRMMKAGVENVICPFQLSGEHAAKLIAG